MDTQDRRRLREALPLPLAQLYSRAYNDKEARSRHNNAYYLIEALIRLSAAVLVAAYREELKQGAARESQLTPVLQNLTLPSAGHWLKMLRELARYFGNRVDAASHPVGHLWDQLTRQRHDRPNILGLYNEIVNGVDGERGDRTSCSIIELFDALVSYRNEVMGHGAERWWDFYEHRMGPQLLPAINELLGSRIFNPLGPEGTYLVYVTEVRVTEEVDYQLLLRELVGISSERMEPLMIPSDADEKPAPDRVAVLWPGRRIPLPLDPILKFQEREIGEEVVFLNSRRGPQKAEYLSYTAGHTFNETQGARELDRLLAEVAGEVEGASEEEDVGSQGSDESQAVGEASRGKRPHIGDYELLAEIGRGGMGVVYLARQVSLERLVALKMLPSELQGDEVAQTRLRRDIRALAQCEHPNIVKLLDADISAEGWPYYTMEHVSGCDLEEVWREIRNTTSDSGVTALQADVLVDIVGKLSRKRQEKLRTRIGSQSPEDAHFVGGGGPDEAEVSFPWLSELPKSDETRKGYVQKVCELVRDAARALETVHKKGIVHRDVSPANLMVAPDAGRVVLMDFGLAKGGDLSRSLSSKEGFVGKLRYAAPEQLATALLSVGPSADVRGLGVTLWEMLTRRQLFDEARDERQLATKVHSEDVPALRKIDPGLDVDLEAIVARATDRNPDRRIQSAGELADYLDRYLTGKPLPIRPPSRIELTGRWVRDNKPAVVSVGMLMLGIAAFIAGIFGFWGQSRVSRQYEKAIRTAYQSGKNISEGRKLSGLNNAQSTFKTLKQDFPNSHYGYLGAANCAILLGYYGFIRPTNAYTSAVTNARRAVDLKECSETWTTLAYIQFAYEYNWEAASKKFSQAVEGDPTPRTHHWYAWFLSAMGKHSNSVDHAAKAIQSAKTSERGSAGLAILYVDKGWCHYYAGNWEEAKKAFENARDQEPNFALAYTGLGQVGLMSESTNAVRSAVKKLETARRNSEGKDELDGSAFILARLGYAYGRAGQRTNAIKVRKQLINARDEGAYIPEAHLALIELGLGNTNKALEKLWRAKNNRSEYVTTLAVDPVYTPLYGNFEFKNLLGELGLMEARMRDRDFESAGGSK